MNFFSSIGKMLGFGGGGGGPAPKLDRTPFDISKQAAEYENRLKEQAAATAAQNAGLTSMLQQQATGQGPLAGAQMRAAANRNLAQTLSAAQSMGGSPLAARQIMQARGQQSRDIAELGLQERMQAQQALGQQLDRASNTQRADAQLGFSIAKSPQEAMQDYEKTRFGADVARRNAIESQQRDILGNVLGGAAKAGMAYLTGGASAVPDVLKGMKAHGGIVEGTPKHKEDTVADDVKPHLLSPGELVVPKTVVNEGPEAIKKFAQKLIELEKKNPSPANGFASLVAMKKQLKKDK